MSVSLLEVPVELETSSGMEPVRVSEPQRLPSFFQRPAFVLFGLTILALLVQGYHPYVDDAAIYLAAIEKVVRPGLFPGHAEYVMPHLRHSLFSYALGWPIRIAHLPLLYTLFAAYVVSLWLTILACWRLACLLFDTPAARWGATVLVTVTLTMPVAGSAIFFADPYLTARSFSTPATLFAIAYVLERRKLPAILCLVVAFVFHPLMAAYAVGFVIALALLRARRWGWLTALALLVMAGGLVSFHTVATPQFRAAVLSRDYFFLSRWQWFEIFGLFPPLAAALLFMSHRKFCFNCRISQVCGASLYTGTIAIIFAACFARTRGSFLLARLQPLRSFQLIYILFFLLLGGVLGRYVLRRRKLAWAGSFGVIAGIMFTVQLCVYSALPHIEWPWTQPVNPWAQAFLWIRGNTPADALFALNPNYQSQPHEDTLGFRATTERSVLADRSKDGGVAAIYPAVAREWWDEVNDFQNLDRWTDQQRLRNLAPYRVSWIVLPAGVNTQFPCPYQNSAVRVCQVPGFPTRQVARAVTGQSTRDRAGLVQRP